MDRVQASVEFNNSCGRYNGSGIEDHGRVLATSIILNDDAVPTTQVLITTSHHDNVAKRKESFISFFKLPIRMLMCDHEGIISPTLTCLTSHFFGIYDGHRRSRPVSGSVSSDDRMVLQAVSPETVGSTAVVALVCSSHIIVSNCGGSRVVLLRGKESMPLSVDQKV
ncbi:putative protein-serine/threonine phosphatase [Arabidopsis thaliana]